MRELNGGGGRTGIGRVQGWVDPAAMAHVRSCPFGQQPPCPLGLAVAKLLAQIQRNPFSPSKPPALTHAGYSTCLF